MWPLVMPQRRSKPSRWLGSTPSHRAISIEEFRAFRPLTLVRLRQLGFHPPQYIFDLFNYPDLKRALQERIDG
jgi:hypothetical protein